jgi:hypothetical protein
MMYDFLSVASRVTFCCGCSIARRTLSVSSNFVHCCKFIIVSFIRFFVRVNDYSYVSSLVAENVFLRHMCGYQKCLLGSKFIQGV